MADRQRYGDFQLVTDSHGQSQAGSPWFSGQAFVARRGQDEKMVSLEAAVGGEGTRLEKLAVLIQSAHHPAFPVVHAVEREGDLVYSVAELAGGGDLRTVIKSQGAMEMAAAAAICQAVAEGLASFHAMGLVHADIKPAHLWLVDGDGETLRIKIGGWHLAGAGTDAEVDRTAFSPEYASPEQAREEPLDARSDLFSLGMTFWHLLHGGTPLTGPVGTLLSERIDASRPYSRKLSGIPLPARQLLESLLEKDKSRRAASAAEIARAFSAIAGARSGCIPRFAAVAPLPSPATPAVAPPEEAPKSWREHYEPTDPDSNDLQPGNPVEAMERATGRAVLLDLQATDISQSLLDHAGKHLDGRYLMPRLLRLFVTAEGWLAVWEALSGESLLSILRRSGKVPFSDAADFLAHLATSFDVAKLAGFPAVDARASEIKVQLAEDGWSGAVSKVRPILLPPQRGADSGAAGRPGSSSSDANQLLTMMPLGMNATGGGLESDEAFSFTASFASLVYYLVGGRQPAMAARISPAALVRISGFGEAGNNLVGRAIAGEFEKKRSCREFLRELVRTENVACHFPEAVPESSPEKPAENPAVTSIPLPQTPSSSPSPQPRPHTPKSETRLAMQLLDQHEATSGASVSAPATQAAVAPIAAPQAAATPPPAFLNAPAATAKSPAVLWWVLGIVAILAIAAGIYLLLKKAPHLL